MAGERGLRLLLVLAFVYPSHFIYQDILKELLSLLGVAGDNIGPLVLSIFTFIGKQKPIGKNFLHDPDNGHQNTVGIQLSDMSGNRMAITSLVTEWFIIQVTIQLPD